MSEKGKITTKASETTKKGSVYQAEKKNVSQTPGSPVEQLLYLQRTVGNQAVMRMLQGSGDSGQVAGGQIQAKLKINRSGDVYEQEADRVAEHVTQAQLQRTSDRGEKTRSDTEGHNSHKKLPGVHTLPNHHAEPTTVPPVVNEVLCSPGQPLDKDTRALMESRFGHDFSQVRLHTDTKAAESVQAVNALAYTVGRDVVFGTGKYVPGTTSGRRLLAHELAHVGQQGVTSSANSSLNRENSSAAEREAEHASENVLSGQMAGFHAQHPGVGLQKTAAQAGLSVPDMSLEEAVKNLPKLPGDQALAVLKQFQKFIIGWISSGEGRIRELMSLRAESFSNYLIGGTIELFGSTSLPSDNWKEPWRHVDAAYSTIRNGQVKESLDHLLSAAEVTSRYWERLNEYLEKTEKGTSRSIFALQVLQATGAVAATALTSGGATAIVVGAGYGTAQNLVGQATAISIGLQDKIDWGGMAFDTVFGLLTGALGGKLGNVVLKKLMGNQAVASLGRRVLSEVVSDLVSGRLSSILQTSARSLFDQLLGRANITMEQFIERLAEQLMDPKAMLLDAIMGRVSKMAHAPSSKASKRGSAASQAPLAETPTRTTTPDAEPAHLTTAAEPLSQTQAVSSKPSAVIPVETPIPSQLSIEPPQTEQPLTPKVVANEPTGRPKREYGEIELPISEGSLELDISGNREGWNKQIEDFHTVETAKVRADTVKPVFREPSTEKGGTGHHTGMHFHELSAAEAAIRLRIDWDPQAGRPRKVSYYFTAESARVVKQVTERGFHQEPRLKGESAQSREKAYVKSGFERGHLAQREAGKVNTQIERDLGIKKSSGPEVERSLDVLTNVVPMTPNLNKGRLWRSAESRTAQFAMREGYVVVEIEPVYDTKPARLSDGTPIPSKFRRIIKSGPTGQVLEDISFDNISFGWVNMG